MPLESTCSCGKRLQVPEDCSARQGQCPVCGELVPIPKSNDKAAGVTPSSDKVSQGFIAAPALPETARPGVEEQHEEEREDAEEHAKGELTASGCILTLITVAVIFGVAVPLVRWRDPETGQPLPRTIAILTPFLIGASFQAIVSLLLRMVGLRIWKKREMEGER